MMTTKHPDLIRAETRVKSTPHNCPIHNSQLWLTEDEQWYCPKTHAQTVEEAVANYWRDQTRG